MSHSDNHGGTTMSLLGDAAASRGVTPPARPRLRAVSDIEGVTVTREVAQKLARPEALSEFIGQPTQVFNLEVECSVALEEQRLPDHILLEGPPGLGKSSLAEAVAERTGARFVRLPGTSMGRVRDVAQQLVKIGEPKDGPAVVYVDEIHLVNKRGQGMLLSALEDGMVYPSGAPPMVLAPFVMVAATTNPGKLETPLRQRFGLREVLDFYPESDLIRIVQRYCERQGWTLGEGAAEVIASVGRGTPRVTINILRRAATSCRFANLEEITCEVVDATRERLGVDDRGLEELDRAILRALVNVGPNGEAAGQRLPTGVEVIAARMNVDVDVVTQQEPFMMRPTLDGEGNVIREPLIVRGGRGRVATKEAYRALGLRVPVWVPVV